MKTIVFLFISSVMVLVLVLSGCGATKPPEQKVIKIAVAGPMIEMQGKNHWWGAELARDEINAGAGVNVGGVYHKIELVQVDTNEISGTPNEGIDALEAVIDDVDFVVGGFSTANLEVYREIAMYVEKIFMNCGAATGSLQFSVVSNYDRYKYWFKVIPYNEWFMVASLYKITVITGQVLKATLGEYGDAVIEEYRVPKDGKLRVAILMENAPWCAGLVTASQYNLPLLGFTLVGTWLVSPTATDITAELSQVAAAKPHIIFTAFAGSVATVYSKQRVELGIPAMTIGINVPGQQKSHWANTGGKCNGEIQLDTWAEGLQNTAKTTAFFEAFAAKTGEYPIYPAGTYDAIYMLKEAFEAVSVAHGWDDIADVIAPANIDALIQYLEASRYTGLGGTIAYYPMPDINLGGGIYALSEVQVRALYPTLRTYNQADWLCAASGAPHIAHDLVYGPGYITGIGSQWQDGRKVGVWPMQLTVPSKEYWDAALTDKYGNWNFEYPGTKPLVIPIEGFLRS